MAIDTTYLLQKLIDTFGVHILSHESPHGMLTVHITSDSNLDVLQYLYDDEELAFRFMTDLTAIHYPDALLPFVVVYHLHSLTTNTRIRLKFPLPLENPSIKSATGIFAAANWMERETYDFFGIQFEGHPNLRRILNVDHMDVFPMRKEFPLEDPNRVDKKDHFFGR